ncbi:MAG: hypothetical protein VX875_09705 [Pseudomonadota bacterium]|nr:hypothetical protein [Pseudomonadota bacterium]
MNRKIKQRQNQRRRQQREAGFAEKVNSSNPLDVFLASGKTDADLKRYFEAQK